MLKKQPSVIPRHTAFLYFIVAAIYIYISDQLLVLYVTDPVLFAFFQTFKGWGFVVVTAILLYFLLKGQMKELSAEMEERRKAEEAEKIVARHWQQIFDASSDAISLVDTNMNFLRFNRAMVELTAMEPEEIAGRNYCEVLYGGDSTFHDCHLSQPDKLVGRIESELQLNDRWYIASVDPVFDEEGKLQYIVHTLHDITNRKIIEESVRSQRNALSSIYSLSTLLRTAKTSGELMRVVLKEAKNRLQGDDGSIILLSPDHKFFTITEAEGLWIDNTGYRFPATEGLCSLVLQSGEPYITEDYSSEDKKLHFLDQADLTGPMVLVPLKTDAEMIGALGVSRRLENAGQPFTAEEVELLSAIGEIAGNALRRQSLFESAQRRLEQLQGLRIIDTAIAGSLDLNLTFNVILNEITTLLNLDAAAILRLEKYTAILQYEAGRGFYSAKLPTLALHPGEGYAGQVIKERKPVYISNLAEADRDPVQGSLLDSENFVTYYAVPLIAKGHIQGVLEVYHREPHEPEEEWWELLKSLAGQTAIAINNAELFQSMDSANLELLQAYDATIEGWAYALDLRDEETEAHSQRVTILTLQIARKMGIKDEEMVHVKRGALLHDIGKVGIPDAILLKPGPLTEEEWEIMRKHPSHAYEMLTRIEYLRPALDIPYCHHEKWDGSGYPRGLKGKEIPLAARIFAVVDVYDALTSDRPYRKAWSKEKTIAHVKEGIGNHFDPDVVKVFLKEVEGRSLK